jgi:hypothetical protein
VLARKVSIPVYENLYGQLVDLLLVLGPAAFARIKEEMMSHIELCQHSMFKRVADKIQLGLNDLTTQTAPSLIVKIFQERSSAIAEDYFHVLARSSDAMLVVKAEFRKKVQAVVDASDKAFKDVVPAQKVEAPPPPLVDSKLDPQDALLKTDTELSPDDLKMED